MASLIEHVNGFAQTAADASALTAGNNVTLNYQQLWQQTEQLAQTLADATKQVDMIVVISHRNHLQVVSLLAGLYLNCPVAIMDLRQGSERLVDILQQGHELLCLVDTQGDKVLAPLLADERLPFVQFYYLLETVADYPERITTKAFECFNTQKRDAWFLPRLPKNTALILYTSGSSGTPKGVCIGADDLTARLQAEQEWFELTGSDTILGVLPLNFDVGVTQLLGSLYAGAHHVLANSWLPADIFNHINARPINGLAMSPMVWRQLLKTKDTDLLWGSLNQLRYLTLSGGTLDIDTLQQILSQLKTTLIKTYGQTEMFRIASLKLKQYDAELLGSVGQAYSGVTLSVVNDAGNALKPYERGEIVASGLGQMLAYVPVAEQDSQPQLQKIEQVFTGDRGYLDEDGHLFIEGRQNEMVKIFDQRIFPDDVAASLQKILGIQPIVVLATEDEEPKLLAFIEGGSTDKSDQELKAQLRGKLAGHLIPMRFERLQQLPSTANGKIDKVSLREQL